MKRCGKSAPSPGATPADGNPHPEQGRAEDVDGPSARKGTPRVGRRDGWSPIRIPRGTGGQNPAYRTAHQHQPGALLRDLRPLGRTSRNRTRNRAETRTSPGPRREREGGPGLVTTVVANRGGDDAISVPGSRLGHTSQVSELRHTQVSTLNRGHLAPATGARRPDSRAPPEHAEPGTNGAHIGREASREPGSAHEGEGVPGPRTGNPHRWSPHHRPLQRQNGPLR